MSALVGTASSNEQSSTTGGYRYEANRPIERKRDSICVYIYIYVEEREERERERSLGLVQ